MERYAEMVGMLGCKGEVGGLGERDIEILRAVGSPITAIGLRTCTEQLSRVLNCSRQPIAILA